MSHIYSHQNLLIFLKTPTQISHMFVVQSQNPKKKRSNKISSISSLFFEEIYILSLPIIDKFLWSLYAEDQLKVQQKALKSRENTEFSRELLLAGRNKSNKLNFMSVSPISMRKYAHRRFR